MEHREKRALIVAICGIDGSGKSTLLNTLRLRGGFSKAHFLARRDRRDWLNVLHLLSTFDGATHAEYSARVCQRWAFAFDFVNFYREQVQPLLAEEALIVVDRWSVCCTAFAHGMGETQAGIKYLMSEIVEPDFTIALEVAPAEAHERISALRKPEADESVLELELFATGYKEQFGSKDIFRLSGATAEEVFLQAQSLIQQQVGDRYDKHF